MCKEREYPGQEVLASIDGRQQQTTCAEGGSCKRQGASADLNQLPVSTKALVCQLGAFQEQGSGPHSDPVDEAHKALLNHVMCVLHLQCAAREKASLWGVPQTWAFSASKHSTLSPRIQGGQAARLECKGVGGKMLRVQARDAVPHSWGSMQQVESTRKEVCIIHAFASQTTTRCYLRYRVATQQCPSI